MKFRPVVQEMPFKDISYLELWQPLCSVDWKHLCNIGRRNHEEQSCEIILKFGPVVQEEISFKGISYLEFWQPFRSAEHNHLCNNGRGYSEEQFCKLIWNLSQWYRRYCLKDFLSGALAALLVSGAEPFMHF